jgi:hypothetical protein
VDATLRCSSVAPKYSQRCNEIGTLPFFPDEIVEGAEVEFFALLQAGFSEKFCDLEFADLVGALCDLALRRGI